MRGNDRVLQFEKDVLPEEKKRIAQRRKLARLVPEHQAAGCSTNGSSGHAETEKIDDCVGLALSGGGIRAASFGLGILQAFYERGVLRLCDYLSTVSGGSYVGGFLASLSVHPRTDLDWTNPCPGQPRESRPENGSSTTSEERHSLIPQQDGSQPPLIRRLIHSGDFLNRTGLFLTSWLPGVLAINLTGLSFLVAVCAAAAWLFRILDGQDAIRVLNCLGFRDDLSRAFFPTFVVFVVWIAYLVGHTTFDFLRGRRVEWPTARRLTMFLLFMAILSAVSLLGVGDVNTYLFEDWLKINISSGMKHYFQEAVSWVLYTAVAVGLLPYLSPRALIRSGTDPRRPRDRYIFNLATNMLFWGCPLLLFAVLAGEDISFYNSRRDDRHMLTIVSLKDWKQFWNIVERASLARARATTSDDQRPLDDPAAAIWDDLKAWSVDKEQADIVSVGNARANTLRLDQYISLASDDLRRASAIEHELTFLGRWLMLAKIPFLTSTRRTPIDQWTASYEANQKQRLALAYINFQILSQPVFFQRYTGLVNAAPKLLKEPDIAPPLDGERLRKLIDLHRRAERIHQQLVPNDPRPVANSSSGNSNAGVAPRRSPALEQWSELNQRKMQLAVLDYLLNTERDRHNQYAVWSSKKTESLNKIATSPLTSNLRAKSLLEEMREVNYLLFKNYFGPGLVHDETTVFAAVVQPADQAARLKLAFVALLISLAAGICVDLNATSIHSFYRDRLAGTWIVQPVQSDGKRLALQNVTGTGAPYLVINGALTYLPKIADRPDHSSGGFEFSSEFCGTPRLGFLRTQDFVDTSVDLADAMAISGAAVTPTVTTNVPVRALLWLTNLRLGQWLLNPASSLLRDRPWFYRRVWRRPTPLHLLLSRFLLPEKDHDYCFVSDGGMHENLGVEALLLRRCRLILAVDAAADPNGRFPDLVKLAFRARVQYGIEFRGMDGKHQLGLADVCTAGGKCDDSASDAKSRERSAGNSVMKAAQPPLAGKHFVVFQIRYPDDPKPAYMIYIRPTFDGDEPEELSMYRKQNEEFPQDATVDQFFDPRRFEAYRYLAHHIGCTVADQINPRARSALNTTDLLASIDTYCQRVLKQPAPAPSASGVTVVKIDDLPPAARGITPRYLPAKFQRFEPQRPDSASESLDTHVQLLAHSDAEYRKLAAFSLAEMADTQDRTLRQHASTALLEALRRNHDSPDVQKTILFALGLLRERRQATRQTLCTLLKSGTTTPEVIVDILRLLQWTGINDPELSEIVKKLRKSPVKRIRSAADELIRTTQRK